MLAEFGVHYPFKPSYTAEDDQGLSDIIWIYCFSLKPFYPKMDLCLVEHR